MYECTICQSLNHSNRHHCQNCGAVPAKYSILGVPAKLVTFNGRSHYIEVVRAVGAVSYKSGQTSRQSLRTVEFDYYAEAE